MRFKCSLDFCKWVIRLNVIMSGVRSMKFNWKGKFVFDERRLKIDSKIMVKTVQFWDAMKYKLQWKFLSCSTIYEQMLTKLINFLVMVNTSNMKSVVDDDDGQIWPTCYFNMFVNAKFIVSWFTYKLLGNFSFLFLIEESDFKEAWKQQNGESWG